MEHFEKLQIDLQNFRKEERYQFLALLMKNWMTSKIV